eukprot:scaffold8852_cov95-Isochrysis_galbana.AAC.2
MRSATSHPGGGDRPWSTTTASPLETETSTSVSAAKSARTTAGKPTALSVSLRASMTVCNQASTGICESSPPAASAGRSRALLEGSSGFTGTPCSPCRSTLESTARSSPPLGASTHSPSASTRRNWDGTSPLLPLQPEPLSLVDRHLVLALSLEGGQHGGALRESHKGVGHYTRPALTVADDCHPPVNVHRGLLLLDQHHVALLHRYLVHILGGEGGAHQPRPPRRARPAEAVARSTWTAARSSRTAALASRRLACGAHTLAAGTESGTAGRASRVCSLEAGACGRCFVTRSVQRFDGRLATGCRVVARVGGWAWSRIHHAGWSSHRVGCSIVASRLRGGFSPTETALDTSPLGPPEAQGWRLARLLAWGAAGASVAEKASAGVSSVEAMAGVSSAVWLRAEEVSSKPAEPGSALAGAPDGAAGFWPTSVGDVGAPAAVTGTSPPVGVTAGSERSAPIRVSPTSAPAAASACLASACLASASARSALALALSASLFLRSSASRSASSSASSSASISGVNSPTYVAGSKPDCLPKEASTQPSGTPTRDKITTFAPAGTVSSPFSAASNPASMRPRVFSSGIGGGTSSNFLSDWFTSAPVCCTRISMVAARNGSKDVAGSGIEVSSKGLST